MPELNTTALNNKSIAFAYKAPTRWVVFIIGFLVGFYINEIVLLLTVVISYYLWVVSKQKEQQIYRHFAADNGFKFKNKINTQPIPKFLSWRGLAPKGYFEIHGQLRDCDFTIFPFAYFSQADYVHMPYKHWIIAVNFDKSFPTFAVDAVNNELSISKTMQGYMPLSLEGDFSDYFRVYCPRNEHVDAMSFLSPDLMMKIYQTCFDVDLVYEGFRVCFISRRVVDDDAVVLQSIFDAADAVVPELQHKLKTYRKTPGAD